MKNFHRLMAAINHGEAFIEIQEITGQTHLVIEPELHTITYDPYMLTDQQALDLLVKTIARLTDIKVSKDMSALSILQQVKL